MRSMTVASLPRILRFRRVPKISAILSPVSRHRPRAEFVGGGLQRGDVVDGEEGVVGLAEADLRALQLLLDEAVPVEVVVREAAALAGEDAVIWILGGVFGDADAKARPLLHALEDEVDAVGVVPG